MTSVRAALWALLALVILAAPASAAPYLLKARWAGVSGSPTIPLLGPGATWSGTLNTVAVPADTGLNVASPILHWMDPSDMPLVTDQVRCVYAFAANGTAANGGIASVEIGSEATTGVQAAHVVYNRPLPRGGTSPIYAWCVQLNSTAFRAASTSGGANLWARATPVDGTLAAKVIGGPVTVSGYDTEAYAGNYPMTIYPRTAENDVSKTVCASGCDFTTIKGAFDNLRVSAFERPLITLMDSGFYVIANAGGAERSTGLRAVITNGPGVTATLGQTSLTLNNTTTWNVTWGWDGVELRGNPASGGSLTIDFQWLSSLNTGAKPQWFNGINVTNSAGFPNIYWNGNVAPGGGANHMSYVDNVVSTNVSGITGFQRYAQNTSLTTTYNSIFTGTHFVYNNITDTYTNDYYIADSTHGVTLRYTPPSGQTTATIEKSSGADNTAGADVIVKANGSAICTIHAGYYSTDAIPTITALVSAINSGCAGVVASINTADRGPFRASSLGGLFAFGATNIFNVDTILGVGYQPHADWWQGTTGGGIARQNVAFVNNTLRNATNVPFWRNDSDFAWNYVWMGNNITGNNIGGPQVSGANSFHMQIIGNTVGGATLSGAFVRDECLAGSPDPGDQVWSAGRNNIVANGFFAFGACGTGNFPWSFPWKNNIYGVGGAFGGAVLNGPNDTGNVNMTATAIDFAGLFTNWTTGDFRPIAAGLLLSNQVAPVFAYDGRTLPFASPDVAGNWSKNDTYP